MMDDMIKKEATHWIFIVEVLKREQCYLFIHLLEIGFRLLANIYFLLQFGDLVVVLASLKIANYFNCSIY